MPTQIIDGFKLNSPTPIDSRLVTTGTASRNSMVYKYDGLRVYDTVQKMSFVYIDTNWEKESSENIVTTSGSGSGNGMNLGGTENYIPKITSYGTTSSIIREFIASGNQRRIGINVPNNKTIDAILHVGGNGNALFEGQVTATYFVGNISGSNVVGPVNVDKLSNPNTTGTYVLKSINNTNQWVAETTGSKIKISKNTDETNLFLVLSKDIDDTGNELYINKNTAQDALAVNASTRQIMAGTSNTFAKPQYSFIETTGTGMYGNSTEIGLSMAGSKRIYVTSTMVGINIGTTTNTVKFEAQFTTINTATSIFGTTNIQGTTNITGNTNIVGTTTITGNTNINGNTTLSGGTTTINGATTVTGATNITGDTKITGKLEVTDTFKYTKAGFGTGKVLTSDTSGNALWTNAISIGIGLPYGSIIVWPFDVASIPSDFKVCNGVGFIFINDSYKAIPDLRDRNITGSSDMTTVSAYGVSSPSTQQTVTLSSSNLPRHKHAISTSDYSTNYNAYANTHKVTATSTFTGNALGNHSHTISSNVQYDGGGGGDSYRNIANSDYPDKATSSDSAGTPSGSVTTTLSGYTDDGTTWHGNIGQPFNIPHSKGWKLILLIKINTDAEIYRSGHYSLNDLGGGGSV